MKNKESEQKTITGLKKARKIVGELIKMEKNGAYCIDIMQKNSEAIFVLRHVCQILREQEMTEKINIIK